MRLNLDANGELLSSCLEVSHCKRAVRECQRGGSKDVGYDHGDCVSLVQQTLFAHQVSLNLECPVSEWLSEWVDPCVSERVCE